MGGEGKGGDSRLGKKEGGDKGKGKGGGKRREGVDAPSPLQIPGSAPALTH